MTPAFNGMLFDRSLICASCGAAVAAVIVAALALVVGRFVRGRPAPLRYGLLLAALVVLGIVPAVAAASRLGGWGAVRISPVAVDRPLAPQPFLVTPAVPRPMPMPAIADGEEALRPERIAEPAVMPLRMPTLREAASGLLWAWLGGLLFFVGMVIRDLVRLRLLRQTLVPCTSPAAVGLLNDAARSVGLTQPPRLFESAAVPVPVVIGPVKPVVVLPAGMANTLDREKLTAVLLHEAAHVVHGDLWVGLLQHAVAAIFWWCPPVHRLNRRLAEVREEICDDYVVLAQGDGFQLAEVLVEMAAGLRGSRQRLTIGTLGAIDEKPALEGRVERLIDLTRKAAPMTRMNRLAVVAAGAFGLVALAIVLATTIHAADEPPAAEPKASPTAAPIVALDAKEQQAVDAALAWITMRQNDDGGWSLDGQKPDRAAATSLAILPFLARGHNHKSPGPYREQISRGINFLITLIGDDGSALKDGETMYSQALVTMTLCRAYGRTRDPALEAPAQAAIDFIMDAQQTGGGWTYTPNGVRGDTSILGYQADALADGQAAGLRVKPEVWAGVTRHLDSVQGDADGSTYGYMAPEVKNPNTTAVGLLCRLRSGWKSGDRGVVLGVDKLLAEGPPRDIYHCYHANKLVHAATDADAWARWRARVADLLIESQVQKGIDAGSWRIEAKTEGKRVGYADLSGPFLKTSLAALILLETAIPAADETPAAEPKASAPPLGATEAKEPPAEAAAPSREPEQAVGQTLTQPENGPGQAPNFPFAGTIVRVVEDKYGVWSVTVSDDTRVSIPRAIVDSLRKSGRQCDTVSVAPLQRLEPTQTPHFKSPGLAVALERGGNRAYIASSEGLDFDVVSIVSDAIRAVGYDEVVLVSKPKASPAALSGTEALAGKWVNVDEKTSSITRLEIQKEADGWVIHAWGSCQPTDCDWGTVPLHMAVDAADAAGIPLDVGQMKYGVAQWDQLDNAIRTFMTLRIEDGELVAESVDVFQNTLGQANIRCKDSFKREMQFLPDATLTRP